jgi:hypothetical protein
MKEESLENILCAAIWFDDGHLYNHQPKNIMRGYVMCGYRHCSIHGQFGKTVKERQEQQLFEQEQGFLTSKNRFVDRIEGAKIAYKAGQIPQEKKKLYSEDLY